MVGGEAIDMGRGAMSMEHGNGRTETGEWETERMGELREWEN